MNLTRRTFLQAAPFFVRAASYAASKPNRDGAVLVVLQLAGGNDGLNTVIPYEDDAYGRARTTLRLTGNPVHKVGVSLGLHPAMDGMARLFKEGHLSVVQGVGYPDMHRDHNSNAKLADGKPDARGAVGMAGARRGCRTGQRPGDVRWADSAAAGDSFA